MRKKTKKTNIVYPVTSYEQLEDAIRDGHTIQLCSVGPNSEAVTWVDIQEVRREWSPARYRIILKDSQEPKEQDAK